MTYFECVECGQLANLQEKERSRLTQRCPACGEPTEWQMAFTDDDEGVTF